MKKNMSRIGFAFIATFVAFSSLTFITSASATGHGLTATGQGAFEDLARCVRSVDSTDLNIFFLVDSSASLRVNDANTGPGSDPDAKRAKILSQTIQQLSSLNDKINVNFALDTFDSTSPGVGKNGSKNKGIGWTKAGESEVKDAANWVETNIPQYSYGQHTNWLAGLTNAQNQLAKAPHASSSACQAIIWFTDGALDIGSNSQNSAALQALCGTSPTASGPGIQSGVIPSLRANNITLIGVLLTSGDLTSTQTGLVSYFHPVLEGNGVVDASSLGGSKSQNFECGPNPTPANYARGAMLVAKNPEDLALLFASIPFMVSKGQEITHKDPNGFTVDKGVASAAVVIPANKWSLTGPGISINESTSNSAYKIHTVGNISTVEFAIPSGGQGDYKVSHNGDTPISVFLDAGVRIKLDDGLKITAGKGAQQISGTFTNYNNKPVDLGVYEKATMSVASIDTSGKNRPAQSNDLTIKNGTWSGTVTPFDGENNAQMQFTVALRTKPSGTELPKISQTFNVPLVFPAQFCNVKSVGTGRNSQTTLSDLFFKKSSATGKITIVGAAEGNCSIQFTAPSVLDDPIGRTAKDFTVAIKGPDGSSNPVLGQWVTIPQGKDATFDVSINSAIKANGQSLLTVPVDIQDQAKSQTIKSSVKINFTNKIPEKNKWALIISLLFIGLLLPLLILQGVNYLFARYKMADIRNTSLRVKVTVDPMGTKVTKADGSPLVLEDRMFEYAPSDLPRPRKFVADYKTRELAHFDSHLPKNPLGNVVGMVNALPGEVIVASESTKSSASGTKAPVSLNLNRLFFATTEIKKTDLAGPSSAPAPSEPSAFDDDFNLDTPTPTENSSADLGPSENSENTFEADLTIYLNIEPSEANQLFASVLSDISASQMWTELARLRQGVAVIPPKIKAAKPSKEKPAKSEEPTKAKKNSEPAPSSDFDGFTSTPSSNATGSTGAGDSFTSLLDDPDDPWA